MNSSTNNTSKGNISTLLFSLAFVALAILITSLASLMLSSSPKAGKYINPNVATTVVGGTIYDKNGRILAMDIPVYNVYATSDCSTSNIVIQTLSLHLNTTPDAIISRLAIDTKDDNLTSKTNILIQKNIDIDTKNALEKDLEEQGLDGFVYVKKQYMRTYPAAFHAIQLIQSIENAYDKELFPIPQFNTDTTYGNDIYLTVDLDIQYLLDLVVQQVYELQNPKYVVAGIIDIKTGKIRACTTYPFYDPNESYDSQGENLAFPEYIHSSKVQVDNIQVIEKITTHNTNRAIEEKTSSIQSSTKEQIKELYTGQSLQELLSKEDGTTSTISILPEENPQYVIFICSKDAKYYTNSSVLDDALEEIKNGLISQDHL